MSSEFKIASFYKFMALTGLEILRSHLISAMAEKSISGTIIIAEEGFNGTVSAKDSDLERFLAEMNEIFGAKPEIKYSIHDQPGFKRSKVKIKNEIVTLKKSVDMSLGERTHVGSKEWNELVADPETVVIDARNDYEFKVGTFRGAINPETSKFSELPDFIDKNFDPETQPKIAMFCTGGIRCEKLAPYLIDKGFRNVFQLKGGILRYLEETVPSESLWQGECFVFDERITVDEELRKGSAADYSAEKSAG